MTQQYQSGLSRRILNQAGVWVLLISTLFACQHEHERMHQQLMELQEKNHSFDFRFTTDSLTQQLVDYFDHRGTSNEQMIAYYLHASACRDMGDAPRAIIYFSEAICRADTLSEDCDYNTLSCVYGQMTELLEAQFLWSQALEASQRSGQYALMAGDTLNALLAFNNESSIYAAMADTAALFSHTVEAAQRYYDYGRDDLAHGAYYVAFHVATHNGLYERAQQMMQLLGSSNIFDESGNLIPDAGDYHTSKGYYYKGVGQVDSAIAEFRAVLSYHDDNLDIGAYRGLMLSYYDLHNVDSVFKYAELYDTSADRYKNSRQTQATAIALQLYNYQHSQAETARQQEVARKRLIWIWWLIVLALVIVGAVVARLRHKASVLKRIKEEYDNATGALAALEGELSYLRSELPDTQATTDLLAQKEAQIDELQQRLAKLEAQIALKHNNPFVAITESDIAKNFHQICRTKIEEQTVTGRSIIRARSATDEEWKQLLEVFQTHAQSCYFTLRASQMKDTELYVCILSYLGFKIKDMATLLGKTSQDISNIRTRIAKRYFNVDGAIFLNEKLRNL